MKIYLIRHSLTEGNKKRRYIGRTDEPLCMEGIALLNERMKEYGYPAAKRVYVSPKRRCIQTAQKIYPGQQSVVIEELAECDFGIFENKNYMELSDCPQYQEWVDGGGMLPFPGGESREAFIERSVRGFEYAVEECQKDKVSSAAFVVHGGTIMSIMERYAFPPGGYYDYQTGNGEGYELIIADADTGGIGISDGSFVRGPGVAVSSGPADWASDYGSRKNYKRLFAPDEKR